MSNVGGAVTCDVVVGGAAGLTAALVLARARHKVTVVDDQTHRKATVDNFHGFPTRDATAPARFRADALAELQSTRTSKSSGPCGARTSAEFSSHARPPLHSCLTMPIRVAPSGRDNGGEDGREQRQQHRDDFNELGRTETAPGWISNWISGCTD